MPQVDGVDVSHWNGTISWNEVPSLDFVACKATEHTSFVDNQFGRNWQAMRNEGFRYRAAYHFFRANYDPITQAQHFLGVVGPLQKGEALVLDVEDTSNPPDKVQRVISELRAVVGDRVYIYTGAWCSSWDAYLGDCAVWGSRYTTSESAALDSFEGHGGGFLLWQWSDGEVPDAPEVAGIGSCDVNQMMDEGLLDRLHGYGGGGSSSSGVSLDVQGGGTVSLRLLKSTSPYLKGEDVRAVQYLLRDRGWSPGSTDGVYGSRTEAAVEAAQRHYGLTADGIVGERTYTALLTRS